MDGDEVFGAGFETVPEGLAGCFATSFFGGGGVVVFFTVGGGEVVFFVDGGVGVFFTGGGVAATGGSILVSFDFSFSTRNGSL